MIKVRTKRLICPTNGINVDAERISPDEHMMVVICEPGKFSSSGPSGGDWMPLVESFLVFSV